MTKELSATSYWLLQLVLCLQKVVNALLKVRGLVKDSRIFMAVQWLRKKLGPVGVEEQQDQLQWRLYWDHFFPAMLFFVLLFPADSLSFIFFLPGLLFSSSFPRRIRPVLLWSAWSFVSALLAPSFPSAVISFFQETTIVLSGLAAGFYSRGKREWFQIILLSLALVISLTFLQAYAAPPFPPSWVPLSEKGKIPFRVTGAGDNPNLTGLYLAYMLPLLLVGWESKNGYWKKIESSCSGILFFLSLPALIFTFSRTSWVAAVFTLVFYWLPNEKGKIIRLILVIIIIVCIFPPLVARILHHPFQSGTFEYRVRIWKETWGLVQKHPVTGVGKEALIFHLHHTQTMRADHLHNLYLQLIVEKGIPSLFIIFWMVYNFILIPSSRSIHQSSLLERGIRAALLGQLVAGLTESVWNPPLLHFLFWFGFALLRED